MTRMIEFIFLWFWVSFVIWGDWSCVRPPRLSTLTYRRVWGGVCPKGMSSWRGRGRSRGGRRGRGGEGMGCMASRRGGPTTMGRVREKKWGGRGMDAIIYPKSYLVCNLYSMVGQHSRRLLQMDVERMVQPRNI